jgi:hypothetical protein
VEIKEDRGVPWQNLMATQTKATNEIAKMKVSLTRAARLLEYYDLATWGFSDILRLLAKLISKRVPSLPVQDDFQQVIVDYRDIAPFCHQVVQVAERHILRLVKYKARIFVEGAPPLLFLADG